ncbi:TPA: Dam family site-specific DNA-(adenine-N6)-methyltransferase [Escherichia coli]|nr:Dam family site-specific DNA-(adenine-N6)-methyltransferase [Escherichia coli]
MKGVLNQRSPLKWAGGKFSIMPQLREYLPKAACLIEPFVGGGSVFMNTDYDHYVLCDSNPALINFYQQLTTNTTKLMDRAWSLFKDGGTPEAYKRHRGAFNTIALATDRLRGESLEWAALFLYLNRYCFNGLHRTNQKGEFNVPFGKHRTPYFPDQEMRLFADKARETRTRFIHADFRTAFTMPAEIRRFSSVHGGIAIYCDPPYLPPDSKEAFTHYNGRAFTRKDHRDLAALMMNAWQRYGIRPVVSNSDTTETRQIYSSFELHTLSVRRSVAASSSARQQAKEVIGIYPPAHKSQLRDVNVGWPSPLHAPHPTTEIM